MIMSFCPAYNQFFAFDITSFASDWASGDNYQLTTVRGKLV